MPADKDEEVFEVVDKENKVIGQELRGNCHKKGICHRAVYCLVFNQEGQLLLQQRAKRLNFHRTRDVCIGHRKLCAHSNAFPLKLCWISQGMVGFRTHPCRKRIGPGEWDLSIAEHLQPGESYAKV